MKPLNALLQGVEKVFKTEKEVSLMKTEHSKKWSHQRDIPSKNILQIFRIPGAKNEPNYKATPKQPVYFQHGLLDSSDGWVCNEESRCLPYIMANEGYDVWLGNSRGTNTVSVIKF